MSNQSNSVCEAKTVNHIAILVSDLARSKDWYCQIFGLRLRQESAESVLLGFGESMIVLRAGAGAAPRRIRLGYDLQAG
jgi:catechol 2,3-dioxygenase-like lactoylglutathione lyase family enzyme